MKFQIDYSKKKQHRKLIYKINDYSFDMEPFLSIFDIDLSVNQLLCAVVNNEITQVVGFCPYTSWEKTNYDVPDYSEGALKILDDLEPGFSYRVNNTNWPVFVNILTGWVCLGNPKSKGEAVEFIDNCVAIIYKGNLISLWLRPSTIPYF